MQCKVYVPRENGSRMNDWIRNRIIFRLFYSIYKKDTKFLRNLMRAIHEIAREIIILNSTGYKTNYLLLWRYPIKRTAVTGQQNGSDRTVKYYGLAMFNVRYKTLLTFVSNFLFLKTCHFN